MILNSTLKANDPKGLSLSLALALSMPLSVSVTQVAVAQTPIAQNQNSPDNSQDNQVIYVDPHNGNDQTGRGNQRSPFKTITQALMVAQPQTRILLAPGTYSERTGENFPLILSQDVIIQGNPHLQGQNVIIEGNGFFVSRTAAGQNVTIAATHKAGGIMGVTVTNLDPRGHGIWIESANPTISHNTLTRNGNTGVSANGNSVPNISHNYFFNNTGNGLLVYGTSKPRVENNEFQRTGFGVSAVENSAPILVGNTFRDNRIGIILEGNATATLRQNMIANSSEVGLMTIGQASADLGYGQEAGGNIFRANRQLDINNSSANQVITAFGNQIDGKTAGKINLQGTTAPVRLASSQKTTTNPPLPLPVTVARPTNSQPLPVNPSRGRVIEITAPAPNNSPPMAATKSNSNLPPLPTDQPAREVIRLSGTSTPPPPPVASGKAIASNRNLPAPPPLAEPYGVQSDTTDIGSNSQPLLSINTNSSNSTGNFAGNSNNRVIEIKQPSNSPPPPPSSSTSSPYPNSSDQRRTLADILVVAPDASNSPPPPSFFPTNNPNSNYNVSAPSTRSSQYKVIVEARNSDQESQVRSLYPDAFRTNYHGRSMLQVGVFSTRQNAEQVLQTLKSAGLGALIIQ
jgi:parallel beta-helix repeat protein